MVSFTGSRVNKAPWYSDADWADYLKIRAKLQRYSDAKIAADEVLYLEGKKRSDFAAINLRPGTLTDEPAGKVELGRLKTPSGKSSRASVAQLAALLLDNKDVKSAWLDMLDGNEDPDVAVQRVVKEGIDDAEGEPFF